MPCYYTIINFSITGILIFNPSPSFVAQKTADIGVNREKKRANKKVKLGNGCYHIFLDIGANIGVHGRYLYEPDKYPKAAKVLEMFDSLFGEQRDNRDFCIFSFEPNPSHWQRLENLTEAYNKMGWNYHHVKAGASNMDGALSFYRIDKGQNNDWGFTFYPPTNALEDMKVEVPVIHLARWMWEEIWDREIPQLPYGIYEGPKVAMKLDIERMEYIVFPDLLISGALCNIVDLSFGEFHLQRGFFPMEFSEYGLHLQNMAEGKEFFNNLMRLFKMARYCKTEVLWEDSEDYLFDGMHFPQPES